MDDLKAEINEHLKRLRKADNQAAAVAWMTQAYKLFERALVELDRPEPPPRLVFMPPKIIEVVQTIPKYIERGSDIVHRFTRRESWWTARTVVYPETPVVNPKPKPEPWTHRDTLRLEAATNHKRGGRLQRKGR